MKYQVILRKKARKSLKRVDKRYKERIFIALIKLSSDPYLGKALVGKLKGYYSLRVWPYRIIYQLFKRRLLVYVIDIGHRQGVYK